MKVRARADYGKLPISFEANRGQFDPQVKFVARGRGYALALLQNEAVMELPSRRVSDQATRGLSATRGASLRMRFLSANKAARITGLDESPGKFGYFLGNDPKLWKTGAPAYGRVKYEDIYRGVDLVFYGNGQRLEYDFIVAPKADPRAIRLGFSGASELRLDANGDLILETDAGEARHRCPVIFQEINGERRIVEGRYTIRNRTVGFELGAYDSDKPLVIDPALSYSTFLGGSQPDSAEAIAVDAEGNAYVTGMTVLTLNGALLFPVTPGAMRVTPSLNGASYIFVTKINAQGNALVYSAIIGGTQGLPTDGDVLLDNSAHGIAVDGGGGAYVTGATYSANFPTTPGAVQTQPRAGNNALDGFALKLNAQGNALVYSTLLGEGNTRGGAIAVDGQGQAWVTGETSSRNFPTTANAFQKAMKNTGSSVFVSKLNATGDKLLYSTYLSSGSGETGAGVAVDAAGAAYVGGTTGSSCARADAPAVEPFPTTDGAFKRDLGIGCVGPGSSSFTFVVKFNPDGTVVFSTLVGVSAGGKVAVDAGGNVYVTGETNKGYEFPTTAGAFQTRVEGIPFSLVGFLTKLNATGSSLVYSTLLNGAPGAGIGVDSNGAACLTGAISSYTFTATTKENPFQAERGVFAIKLNPAGSAPVYSVALGDGHSRGLAVDSQNNVYIAGYSDSDEIPVTSGAFQTRRAGGVDVFVAKLNDGAARPVANVSAASYQGGALAGESIVAAFGSGLATGAQAATSLPLPMTIAGTTVKVIDSAGVERGAPLFFVSPFQVNYLMPPGVATGSANITVKSDAGGLSTATARIEAVAPGLFTADASGRGLASAIALRIRAGGELLYEPVARYDQAQGRMTAAPIDLGPETDQVFLILFGTGLRNHGGLSAVNVTIGGVGAQTLFAGAQGGFFGLDQINARIPRNLAGRGEVDVTMTVNGVAANTVNVHIK